MIFKRTIPTFLLFFVLISCGDDNAADNNVDLVLKGTPAESVTAGSAYSFIPEANDPNGDSLTFSIENKPAWADSDTSTGALTGIPGNEDAGKFSDIIISVSDGNGETASLPAFSIKVYLNKVPLISGTPDLSVTAVTSSYSFVPDASDPENDKLTFTIENKPAWADFDPSTGALTGAPENEYVGTYSDIVISVSDGISETVSLPAFSITVYEGNSPPNIGGYPKISVTSGHYYSFVPTVNDPDGDSVAFSIENMPAWASFNSSTGAINGTPADSSITIYNDIIISVSDDTNEKVSLPAFSIVVDVLSTVLKTGQGDSIDYDDGYYKAGVNRNYARDAVTGKVHDLATGLVWQDDKEEEKMTWYNATWYYCDGLILGGYDDWRMPSMKEMETILDYGYGAGILAINDIFNYVGLTYWTASYSDVTYKYYYYINFFLATTYYGDIFDAGTYEYCVRCVRGDTLPESSFTRDDTKEIVTDYTTNLMWQDDSAVANVNEDYTWQEAIDDCECLSLGGYDDWRLPNINELKSILDYSMCDPAINSAFRNISNDEAWYWSSTIWVPSKYGWVVGSVMGNTVMHAIDASEGYLCSARCVRGGL